MLIIKYDRIDFFGQRIYTEDKINRYDLQDVKKAFCFFGKNQNSAIQIENTVLAWDSMTDYEKKVVTVYEYEGMNRTDNKWSFDKVKKDIYNRFR